MLTAVNHGRSEVVRWLIREGKASVDQADNAGKTPLYNAAYYGHAEIVQWLIGEGNASVDQANDVGQTPLFAAVLRCSEQVYWRAHSVVMTPRSAGCDMGMLLGGSLKRGTPM